MEAPIRDCLDPKLGVPKSFYFIKGFRWGPDGAHGREDVDTVQEHPPGCSLLALQLFSASLILSYIYNFFFDRPLLSQEGEVSFSSISTVSGP